MPVTYDEAFTKTLEYFNNDELATKVWLDKYALRDNNLNLLESSPTDMHWRLAKEFARIEKQKFKEPYSVEFIFNLFDKFKYLIPQGSPMYGIGNDYTYQSLGNCFTLGEHPYDSYGGILYADQMLVQLSKRRCGVGLCLDKIRPKGMITKNAAKTTDGIGVFMQRFSNSIREVAQSGRRGALLQGISVHHPEIETFINIKKDITKVTGANISILLTDEFMQAVKSDTEYQQRWPINGTPQVTKQVKARLIWNQIVEAAWKSAEPGLLFLDRARNYGLSHQYAIKDNRFADIITNPSLHKDTKVLVKNINHYSPEWKTISSLSTINISDYQILSINNRWEYFTCICSGKNEKLYKISFDNGAYVLCTKEHKWPIFNSNKHIDNNQFKSIPTIDLQIGQFICSATKSPNNTIIRAFKQISSIEETDIYDDVYDITVYDDTNTFLIDVGYTGNCGELWIGLDSCRLFLINLFNYVKNPFTHQAEFDYTLFSEHCQISQRLMDDIVDLEIEKIDRILNKIKTDPEPDFIKQVEIDMWQNYRETAILGRRTGLGITALGDTLAALNIKYGSDESIKVTEEIYKNLAIHSMKSSCEMAEELGAFPLYDKQIEKNHPFLENLFKENSSLKKLYDKYGRRNISLTTTAPAGTVSVLSQTTSGIEPAYLLEYKRKRKISNDASKYDFIDATGDKWEENIVYHHHLKTWMKISGETDIKKSPYWGATSNDIDWEKSVDIQAAAQKWITHSISKTCNIPNNASKELVSNIYMSAWEKGCKGFTVYRDGCRDGVLTALDSKIKETIRYNDAPKRPKELQCKVFHVTKDKQEYFILIGYLDQHEPFECFAGKNHNHVINKKVTEGKIIKLGRGKYRAEFNDDTELSPLKAFIDPEEEILTRMVSMSLRHGAKTEHIVHQLEKSSGDLQSLSKAISRALKSFVKDGVIVSGEECPECKSQLIRQEGCRKCSQCSYSAC